LLDAEAEFPRSREISADKGGGIFVPVSGCVESNDSVGGNSEASFSEVVKLPSVLSIEWPVWV
jgi:hypothetical protein